MNHTAFWQIVFNCVIIVPWQLDIEQLYQGPRFSNSITSPGVLKSFQMLSHWFAVAL